MGLVKWLSRVDGWLCKGLPGYCAFCLSETSLESGWCGECYQLLPWNIQGCRQCKEPLGVHRLANSSYLCENCQGTPPLFSSTTAELLYQEPISELIHDFKFHASPRAGALLVELMLANVPSSIGIALLPVPMFGSRARERGFNQAQWLAHQLGGRLDIPIANALCTKQLPSQRSLNRRQRMENLSGAFHVQEPLPEHVTIIDDVVTTGSTGQALAAAALNAGARRVDIWAVARTPLDKS